MANQDNKDWLERPWNNQVSPKASKAYFTFAGTALTIIVTIATILTTIDKGPTDALPASFAFIAFVAWGTHWLHKNS